MVLSSVGQAHAQLATPEAGRQDAAGEWVNIGYSPRLRLGSSASVPSFGVSYFRLLSRYAVYGSAHYQQARSNDQLLLSAGAGLTRSLDPIAFTLSAGPALAYLIDEPAVEEEATFSFGFVTSLQARLPVARNLGVFAEGMWNPATQGNTYALRGGLSITGF
jgi:hypothetical protein